MQQAGVGFNSIRQGAGETLLAGREAEGTGGALGEGGNTKRNPNRSPLLLVVMFSCMYIGGAWLRGREYHDPLQLQWVGAGAAALARALWW